MGLDCGGSTTRLLASRDGEVIFESSAGPGNWASTPRALLMEHLREVFERCPKPAAVAACFAGLLTRDDMRQARTLISTFAPQAKCEAYSDAYAALRACDDDRAVVVISGTGALVFSKPEDRVRKTGGGGPAVDDSGSGMAVGRRAVRTWLKRDPGSEELTEHIRRGLDIVAQEDLVNEVTAAIYRSDSPAARLAHLGAYVARTDIPQFDQMVKDEVGELARLCRIHIEQIGPNPANVYRTGGFWNAAPKVIRYFEEALGLSTSEPSVPPLTGALWLAQDLMA